jgi:hypothetical protein
MTPLSQELSKTSPDPAMGDVADPSENVLIYDVRNATWGVEILRRDISQHLSLSTDWVSAADRLAYFREA